VKAQLLNGKSQILESASGHPIQQLLKLAPRQEALHQISEETCSSHGEEDYTKIMLP
jgi:hypothetical protein